MDHYSTKENKCRFNKSEWQMAEEYKQIILKGMSILQRNASDPNSQKHYFNIFLCRKGFRKIVHL